ncbi:MAG TPA: hypothetical protein VF679_12045, partial [Pedobacter sp.]
MLLHPGLSRAIQVNFWEVASENGSFDLLPKPDTGPRFLALFKSISCTAPTGRPGFVFDYEAKVYHLN